GAPHSRPAAIDPPPTPIRPCATTNRTRPTADGSAVCAPPPRQAAPPAATAATERAASATAGLVLMRDGIPVPVYYSASCGGYTEVPSAGWAGKEEPPHFPPPPDHAGGGAAGGGADNSRAHPTRGLQAAASCAGG